MLDALNTTRNFRASFPDQGDYPMYLFSMGNISNKYEEATDDSEDELDSSVLEANPNQAVEMLYETDASINSGQGGSVPTVQAAATRCEFEFTNELSDYEKISLIFLLNGNPDEALNQMKHVLEDSATQSIFPACFNLHNQRDKDKLIEAVCIIQNYEILRKYYNKTKSDLIQQYKPLQRCTSIGVNVIKKCLYRLFEDMTSSEHEEFINSLRKDLSFPRFEYLEMYFTYFETVHFVSLSEFGNIEKALGQIKKEAFYSDLLELERRGGSNQMNVDRARTASIYGETSNFQINAGAGVNFLESYHIDEDYPGIVVIIDNENFYSEPEPDLRDKVLSTTGKLSDRTGSKWDSHRLRKSFKRFNYEIIEKPNLTHQGMLHFVHDVAHNQFKPEHSSIFICLMSHGIEGMVIGCNSIAVAISDIKKQLNSPNLKGKPKVLIIQSCQGDEIQTLTTDGFEVNQSEVTTKPMSSDQLFPYTMDYLELWSTVPGYASIRNVQKGSWFIQNLCDVLDSCGEGSNMDEICIQTRNKLLEERWTVTKNNKTEERLMVCETRGTLRKRLLLPRVVNK